MPMTGREVVVAAWRWFFRASTALLVVVSSLPLEASAFDISSVVVADDHLGLALSLARASSAVSAYVGLVAWYDRPRGELYVDAPTTLRVSPSLVPNAGAGLFATRSLPEGTRLGTYPGVVRPAADALAKLRDVPSCETYVWRFTDDLFVVDPTDTDGRLPDECRGGSWRTPLSGVILNVLSPMLSLERSTVLARINEPPMGADCNVRSTENLETREVLFAISRDVTAGEELFMDYGLTYDRSSYAGGQG